jgi:hypothetical protein
VRATVGGDGSKAFIHKRLQYLTSGELNDAKAFQQGWWVQPSPYIEALPLKHVLTPSPTPESAYVYDSDYLLIRLYTVTSTKEQVSVPAPGNLMLAKKFSLASIRNTFVHSYSEDVWVHWMANDGRGGGGARIGLVSACGGSIQAENAYPVSVVDGRIDCLNDPANTVLRSVEQFTSDRAYPLLQEHLSPSGKFMAYSSNTYCYREADAKNVALPAADVQALYGGDYVSYMVLVGWSSASYGRRKCGFGPSQAYITTSRQQFLYDPYPSPGTYYYLEYVEARLVVKDWSVKTLSPPYISTGDPWKTLTPTHSGFNNNHYYLDLTAAAAAVLEPWRSIGDLAVEVRHKYETFPEQVTYYTMSESLFTSFFCNTTRSVPIPWTSFPQRLLITDGTTKTVLPSDFMAGAWYTEPDPETMPKITWSGAPRLTWVRVDDEYRISWDTSAPDWSPHYPAGDQSYYTAQRWAQAMNVLQGITDATISLSQRVSLVHLQLSAPADPASLPKKDLLVYWNQVSPFFSSYPDYGWSIEDIAWCMRSVNDALALNIMVQGAVTSLTYSYSANVIARVPMQFFEQEITARIEGNCQNESVFRLINVHKDTHKIPITIPQKEYINADPPTVSGGQL